MNLVLAFNHLFQKRSFGKKWHRFSRWYILHIQQQHLKTDRKLQHRAEKRKHAYISIKLPSESPVKQRVVGRDKQRLQNAREKYLLKEHLQCNSVMSHIDWVKVLWTTRHKIGHIGDVLPSQSLGVEVKKVNLTQQKQTTQEQNSPR